MKGITKTQEPTTFKNWKAQANEDWQPSFNNLQNPEKADLRKALVEEQGYICAYCCSEIENDNRTTVIEHFIPQSNKTSGKQHELDYDNLFACCDGIKKDDKSEQAAYCCDESKKAQFTALLIKPTELNESGFICEQAFGYTFIGGIFELEGAYYEKAKYTIEVLKLGIEELQRQRQAALAFLFEDVERGIFFDFTNEEVQILRSNYSNKTDGKFYPFCQAVIYILNSYF